MFDIVSDLANAFGPSGDEEAVRDIIERKIKSYVDYTNIDTLGNLIAVKKGTGKKIMLAAHMDEIGIMITYIDDKGFLRFAAIGEFKAEYCIGQRVRFKNGVIGTVFVEESSKKDNGFKFSEMYIDIGARSLNEAEKIINIGDTACFMGEAVFQNNFVISKALDNRVGCAILVKTIIEMPKTDNELYFVFSSQKKLGGRGVKVAAYEIRPDLALTVDVTPAGDTPGTNLRTVSLGKGVAIKVKDRLVISHPKVKNMLLESARAKNIPYQLEVISDRGSDAGSIYLTAGGIPSGGLSVPCRYINSPLGMVNMNDVENTFMLVKEFINAKD